MARTGAETTKRRVLDVRPCASCGVDMDVRNKTRLYCGEECRAQAYRNPTSVTKYTYLRALNGHARDLRNIRESYKQFLRQAGVYFDEAIHL